MDLPRFIASLLHPLPTRPIILDLNVSDPRHALGQAGEKLARHYLKHIGLKPLYQNFRGVRGGEIDIVARDKTTLVFLEVKTRTDDTHSRPADAVTPAKQKLITRGAREWLRLLGNPPIRCRFDVLEIIAPPHAPPQFNLIRDAFTVPTAIQAELG